MLLKILYLSWFFDKIVCQLEKIDLHHCKLSHKGTEFSGNVHLTESGIVCQQWSANDPHEVDISIKDEDFIDGKKAVAKNHCRNPNGMFSGPWCYTVNPDVSDELCNIPLCSSACRITIAGSEYSGNISVSQTNRKCLGWSEKQLRKYENRTGILTSDRVLQDDKFPEKSRKKAGKHCRNPTSDPNGLWCFVEGIIGDKEVYEKEYCDVDFCDPASYCSVATDLTTDMAYYTHFIKLRGNPTSFSFSVQLWNLADFKNATLRIAFSVLPLSLSGEHLFEFKTGIEIVIKNNGIGFIGSKGQIQDWHEVHGLLSGITRKEFIIEWLVDKVYLSMIVPGGKHVEFEYADLQNKNQIMKNHDNSWFSYYSIRGTPALWNMPCQKETECEEHITLTPTCSVHKKMQKTNFDHIVSFFARSAGTMSIELRNGPGSKYPFFRIDILGAFNKTTLYVVTHEGSMPKYLSSVAYETIISNWYWTEFYLSAVGDRLQLIWIKQIISSETIFDIRHPMVRNAKWFSICSESVAFWAFRCQRNEIMPAPTPNEPECIKAKQSTNYVGTHWISNSGQPCLPWTYSLVKAETKSYQFPGGSRSMSWNYCRNPVGDNEKPFCFVGDKNSFPTLRVKKEYCNVPQCLGTDCKISGTGIEYEGDLSISRSNRTCKLSQYYLKTHGSQNKEKKEVYCQNPDQNPLGPWCNTTDPNMKTDLCNLPDCSVNDACTIVLRSTEDQWRRFMFYSSWLLEKFTFKIKMWNPNAETAVGINMFFGESLIWFYSLIIGRENQTKVQLYYVEEKIGIPQKMKLLREKIIPKIIPASHWQGFWLQTPGRDLELGFEGSETPIFSWSPKQKEPTMKYGPISFISFHTLSKYDIGLNFPCSYCFVERCIAEMEDAFYPMNLWSESNTHTGVLTLSMRTVSWFNLREVQLEDNSSTFIKFYEDHQNHFLTIMINFTSIELTLENPSTVLDILYVHDRILQDKFWTVFKIEKLEPSDQPVCDGIFIYSDKHINVRNQFRHLLNYTFDDERRFRFYYFTVVTLREITSWIANCPAPYLDPPFTPGGWSEWTEACSVPCGGGIGYRRRYCNNPIPHVLGYPCSGPSLVESECNQFECGCLDPKLVENAERSLSNLTYNVNVTEHDDLILDCEYSVLVVAQNNSPGSHISWLKDGFKISDRLKLANLDLNETKLRIQNVEVHHSGIYMCIINPDCVTNENEFVVIRIVSVVVITKKVKDIRQTTLLRLVCNSPVMQYFFSNLAQSWELNDFLYIDYSTADLTEVNYEYIADVETSYEGVWRCYINQTKFNLVWTTNQMNIRVIDPPTFFTYLTETDAPSIIFNGWNLVHVTFFLYFVIIVEIGLVTYIVIWYWRIRKELMGK